MKDGVQGAGRTFGAVACLIGGIVTVVFSVLGYTVTMVTGPGGADEIILVGVFGTMVSVAASLRLASRRGRAPA